MKATILLALLLLFTVPGKAMSSADSGLSAEFQEHLQRTSARLELSDTQRAELEPILRTRFEGTRSLLERHGFGQSSGARPKRRALLEMSRELSALREATDHEVAAILSENQMATYRQIQEEQRARLGAQVRARPR